MHLTSHFQDRFLHIYSIQKHMKRMKKAMKIIHFAK